MVLLPTLEAKAFQVQALDGYYVDEEQAPPRFRLKAEWHIHPDEICR